MYCLRVSFIFIVYSKLKVKLSHVQYFWLNADCDFKDDIEK